VSTAKHPVYQGRKILLTRLANTDGTLKTGTIVAVDAAQAGVGDLVLVAAGGGAASDILGFDHPVPIRSVVVAVIDTVDVVESEPK
jgi:microcompartment protein CcmK/EutM